MSGETATVVESENWIQIDKKTGMPIGEIKEVDVVMKPVDRNGFMITYLATIVQMIDRLGNQKMKVVKYILQKMDKSTNTLIRTVDEISKDTKISDKTVRETLKILESTNIISRRPGVIMLSPKLVHRGDIKKERYLMTRFYEIQGLKMQPVDLSEGFPKNIFPIEQTA